MTRILVAPGVTREAGPGDEEYLRDLRRLIEDAADGDPGEEGEAEVLRRRDG